MQTTASRMQLGGKVLQAKPAARPQAARPARWGARHTRCLKRAGLAVFKVGGLRTP